MSGGMVMVMASRQGWVVGYEGFVPAGGVRLGGGTSCITYTAFGLYVSKVFIPTNDFLGFFNAYCSFSVTEGSGQVTGPTCSPNYI